MDSEESEHRYVSKPADPRGGSSISYRTLINYIIRELEKTNLLYEHNHRLEKVYSEMDSEAEFFRELCEIYKIHLSASKIFS